MSEDLISRQAAMDAVKSAECMHIFELSEVIPKIRALPAISAVPVVRCKDCKHRPKEPNFETYESGFGIEFPEGSKCPCRCSGDGFYSWYPEDDWFCADGERR